MEMHYVSGAVGLILIVMFSIGVFMLHKNTSDVFLRINPENVKEKGAKLSALLRKGAAAKKLREKRVDAEIYESIVLLRNIISLDEGNEMGAENVISILSAQTKLLQPAFGTMLTLMRVGKTKEAYDAFEREAGTDMGKELGSLLLHWDDIEPVKLLEILETQQQNIRQRRITYQKRKDEITSEIIYLPVIVNVFVIFINFVYVGFFLQQQEMLEAIFL